MSFGSKIVELKEVDSTNNFAKKLLKDEALPNGTLIIAENQVAGRGQTGNVWETEAAMNFTGSYVVFPKFLNSNQSFFLYQITALAVRKCLEHFGVSGTQVKWPNDVLVNSKKVCGTLIENGFKGSKLEWSVLGIGLNVNQINFSEGIHGTSMKLELGREFIVKEVQSALNIALNYYYRLASEGEYQQIAKEYLEHLYLLNEWAEFVYNSNTKELMIIGVSNSGMLQLKDREGKMLLADVKELKYLSLN